jgi:hypothetical protein
MERELRLSEPVCSASGETADARFPVFVGAVSASTEGFTDPTNYDPPKTNSWLG